MVVEDAMVLTERPGWKRTGLIDIGEIRHAKLGVGWKPQDARATKERT
jgi:hypothetical protein